MSELQSLPALRLCFLLAERNSLIFEDGLTGFVHIWPAVL